MAMKFTNANFQSEVLESGVPVLVDFYAEWCGPCKQLGPFIEKLAADYEGRAKVGKVNIDEDMDLALKYGVQAVPTVVIIKNGEIYSRMVGVADKKSLTGRGSGGSCAGTIQVNRGGGAAVSPRFWGAENQKKNQNRTSG